MTQAVNNNRLIRILMESNAYIFTASKGTEYSLEMGGDIQHGVFTYTILQGLRGGAATVDNTISVYDLNSYARREVQRITNGAQTPTGTGIAYEDFTIAVIE